MSREAEPSGEPFTPRGPTLAARKASVGRSSRERFGRTDPRLATDRSRAREEGVRTTAGNLLLQRVGEHRREIREGYHRMHERSPRVRPDHLRTWTGPGHDRNRLHRGGHLATAELMDEGFFDRDECRLLDPSLG